MPGEPALPPPWMVSRGVARWEADAAWARSLETARVRRVSTRPIENYIFYFLFALTTIWNEPTASLAIAVKFSVSANEMRDDDMVMAVECRDQASSGSAAGPNGIMMVFSIRS